MTFWYGNHCAFWQMGLGWIGTRRQPLACERMIRVGWALRRRAGRGSPALRQDSGDTQLRQSTVEAGQEPSEPHRATPSDIREVTGDQRAAGFKSGRLAW